MANWGNYCYMTDILLDDGDLRAESSLLLPHLLLAPSGRRLTARPLLLTESRSTALIHVVQPSVRTSTSLEIRVGKGRYTSKVLNLAKIVNITNYHHLQIIYTLSWTQPRSKWASRHQNINFNKEYFDRTSIKFWSPVSIQCISSLGNLQKWLQY